MDINIWELPQGSGFPLQSFAKKQKDLHYKP